MAASFSCNWEAQAMMTCLSLSLWPREKSRRFLVCSWYSCTFLFKRLTSHSICQIEDEDTITMWWRECDLVPNDSDWRSNIIVVPHTGPPEHFGTWGTGPTPLIFAIFLSKRIDCGPHHISSLAPTKMFDVPTALTHARKARARAFWCQWVYHWFNWRCASHHSACYIPST